MSQTSTSVLSSTADDFAALLVEPIEHLTEADSVLDEAAWLALLIQIDREEGGP